MADPDLPEMPRFARLPGDRLVAGDTGNIHDGRTGEILWRPSVQPVGSATAVGDHVVYVSEALVLAEPFEL